MYDSLADVLCECDICGKLMCVDQLDEFDYYEVEETGQVYYYKVCDECEHG